MIERLTKRDEYVNADVIGVDSAELQFNLEFDELDKNYEKLYIAIFKQAAKDDFKGQRKIRGGSMDFPGVCGKLML